MAEICGAEILGAEIFGGFWRQNPRKFAKISGNLEIAERNWRGGADFFARNFWIFGRKISATKSEKKFFPRIFGAEILDFGGNFWRRRRGNFFPDFPPARKFLEISAAEPTSVSDTHCVVFFKMPGVSKWAVFTTGFTTNSLFLCRFYRLYRGKIRQPQIFTKSKNPLKINAFKGFFWRALRDSNSRPFDS
ncbi:MAG: hypothetical protein J5556_03410 [Deltaproteobacteria bacterium]|nr:hypothetical protein [Deltaproteobacteria bacterium]